MLLEEGQCVLKKDHKIPEERKSHLHHGRSLKSHNDKAVKVLNLLVLV